MQRMYCIASLNHLDAWK